MKAQTFQAGNAIWDLKTKGVYRPKLESILQHGSMAEEPFQKAYRWMEAQFSGRIRPLRPGHGLVWLWPVTFTSLTRQERPSYRITVDIDPSRLLISDFDDWHSVLNNYPLQPVEMIHREDAALFAFSKAKRALLKSWGRSGESYGLLQRPKRRDTAAWNEANEELEQRFLPEEMAALEACRQEYEAWNEKAEKFNQQETEATWTAIFSPAPGKKVQAVTDCLRREDVVKVERFTK